MVGLASCLLAASQLELEVFSKAPPAGYETQVKKSASKAWSDFGFTSGLELKNDRLQLVGSDLVSDYLPSQTNEASNFSHLKQRPQFEPIFQGSEPWLAPSNKFRNEYALKQPRPWFMKYRSERRTRIAGWKESNLIFNKHIYFI